MQRITTTGVLLSAVLLSAVGVIRLPGVSIEISMKRFRLLRVSSFCLCLFSATAYAQVPETQMLESLHSALDLKSTQEDSWKTFEQAYVIDPQEIAQRRKAAITMLALTAPQRMDMAINLMKVDLASLERRGEALRVFYSTLSPQQQVMFDKETMPP